MQKSAHLKEISELVYKRYAKISCTTRGHDEEIFPDQQIFHHVAQLIFAYL
jgi:hypothetical protein